MFDNLKNFGRASKRLTIAYRICDNLRERTGFAIGRISHSNGSTFRRHATPETSVNYIRQQFDDYLHYSGLSPEQLGGRRILEIGHGDNYGIALLCLAHGAKQVICLDKYYSVRDSKWEHAVYTLLRNGLDHPLRQRFDEAIQLREGIHLNPEKLAPVYGVKLEEADQRFGPASFDLIISRAVVQYLAFDGAFAVMDRMLAPHGSMIHRIDLRDIGMFTNGGLHALTFLTVPDRFYRWMASDSPQPNRKRINEYRQKMKDLGYTSKFLITRVLGREHEVVPHPARLVLGENYTEESLRLLKVIRPKLVKQFRDLPDEDLLVTGIFLVAQKPAQPLREAVHPEFTTAGRRRAPSFGELKSSPGKILSTLSEKRF